MSLSRVADCSTQRRRERGDKRRENQVGQFPWLPSSLVLGLIFSALPLRYLRLRVEGPCR
jgi:hypothetical protein